MLDKQKDIDAHRRRHARSHARGDRDRRRWTSASTCTCRSRSAGRCRKRGISPQKAKANPKVVTQMGNQGHSTDGARTGYEYITGGAIGDVREVHVWTNRPLGYWPQGIPRPAPLRAANPDRPLGWNGPGVDARLAAAMVGNYPFRTSCSWDLFLGVAPQRRLPPDLSPVQLARLGGLGPGRARRHGRAPHRSPVLVAEPRHADDRSKRISTPFNGATLSERDDDVLRVPGARQHAAGEADVVRRRVHAAEAGGDGRRAAERRRGHPLHRHQGQDAAGHLRPQPAAAPEVAARVVRRAEAEARAHRARGARDELGGGDQGQGRDLQPVRVRGAADRGHAARRRRAACRRQDPLRRREQARHQHDQDGEPGRRSRTSSSRATTGKG